MVPWREETDFVDPEKLELFMKIKIMGTDAFTYIPASARAV